MAPARPPAARPRSTQGTIAFLLGLLAAVVAPILALVAVTMIAAGSDVATVLGTPGFDLAPLAPVRGWVLLGECAFWAGTVAGIAALTFGIGALVRRRAPGLPIAAVVLGSAGPFVFLTFVPLGLAIA